MARVEAVYPPRTRDAAVSNHRIIMCAVAFLLLGLPSAHSQKDKVYLDAGPDIRLVVDDTLLLHWVQVGEYNTTLTMTTMVQHPDIVQLVPPSFETTGSDEPNASATITQEICVYGKSPGHSEVTFNVTPAGVLNVVSVFLRVVVMHSNVIYVISYIMGWIYFAAWSVSFYPQIYVNFKRKSVVGLNFDYVVLNIMGYTMYSLFNCGLYLLKDIQDQYFTRYPRGHNPVQLNDVFFSLHGAAATLFVVGQCIVYEVYMNYKRKSTVGWSIGNIFLDFVGGFLSILQMMLNAYNYNDWASFFGDFTKFGLGAFSLIFDVFFILQHYVFYRTSKDFIMVKSRDESPDNEEQ